MVISAGLGAAAADDLKPWNLDSKRSIASDDEISQVWDGSDPPHEKRANIDGKKWGPTTTVPESSYDVNKWLAKRAGEGRVSTSGKCGSGGGCQFEVKAEVTWRW